MPPRQSCHDRLVAANASPTTWMVLSVVLGLSCIAFVVLIAQLGPYGRLCSAITWLLVLLGLGLVTTLAVSATKGRRARSAARDAAAYREALGLGSRSGSASPGKAGAKHGLASEDGLVNATLIDPTAAPRSDSDAEATLRLGATPRAQAAACSMGLHCCGTWACLMLGAISVLLTWVVLGVYAHLALTTLPMVSGTSTFAGLDGDVHVQREPNGMVHVEATASVRDGAFAQGVVHAQERLWQLEFQRRVGAGRLAEVVGSAGLKTDKQMRTFGFYAAAQAAYGALTDLERKQQQGMGGGHNNATTSTKALLDAYVAGINAYLTSPDRQLPLEFWLLGFEPEPWTPADSLVWAKLMSFDLSGNMEKELARYRMRTAQNLSTARINELLPPYDASRYPTVILPQDLQGGGRMPGWQAGDAPAADADASAAAPVNDATTEAWLDRFAELERAGRRDARRAAESSPADADAGAHVDADADAELEPLLPADLRPFLKLSTGSLGLGAGSLGASNNWVVGGKRTSTGMPFLCNDPHLTLMAPSIWFVMHLHTPDWGDVIGASFAGLPGIVIGHNQHIAWGVTNTGADVQDLYMMQEGPRGSAHEGKYFYRGAYHAYNATRETIKVKGQADVVITVRRSVYGPVVTDNGVAKQYATAPLSLHWTTLMSDSVPDTTLEGFARLNRARDWAAFREGLSYYVAPSQNFIFAAVDGAGTGKVGNEFGYQMPGSIPFRKPGHTGAYPIPGTGDYDWGVHLAANGDPVPAGTPGANLTVFIPFDSLPRTRNPSRGYVVTANNRVTPPNYRYNITTDWDAGSTGYRAKRITDMVEAGGSGVGVGVGGDGAAHGAPEGKVNALTQDDMKAIQLDYRSNIADDLLPYALAIAPSALQPRGLAAHRVLSTWSVTRTCDVGNRAATVFQHWLQQLLLLGGEETGGEKWSNGEFIYNALKSDTSPRGTDPACLLPSLPVKVGAGGATGTGGSFRNCTEFVMATLNRVGSDLNLEVGSGAEVDLGEVDAWGQDTHLAEFKHQILSASPLACLADRFVEHGGDRSSVNVGPYSTGKEWVQDAGPSYRQVVNAKYPEQSSFLNPLGQSGNELSAHYDDLLDMWSKGDYMAMRTSGYTVGLEQVLKKA